MFRDDYPLRLCRSKHVNPNGLNLTDAAARTTRARSTLTPLVLALISLALTSLLFFVLRPETKKVPQPTRLAPAQVEVFQALSQKIGQLDQEIAQVDQRAASFVLNHRLDTPTAVEQYYQQLSQLQELKIDRARSAENYNGLARNLFELSGIPPSELEKVSLPQGIR